MGIDLRGIMCCIYLVNLIVQGCSETLLCGTNLQELYDDTKWKCENGKVVLLQNGANRQTTPPEIYTCGGPSNPYDAANFECIDGSIVPKNKSTTPKVGPSTAAYHLSLISIGASAALFVLVVGFVIWYKCRKRAPPSVETEPYPL